MNGSKSIGASRECPVCRSPNPSHARFCYGCGYRFMMSSSQSPITQSPPFEPSPPQVGDYDFRDRIQRLERSRSGTLTAGAILTILCGVLDILGGVILIGMGSFVSGFDTGIGSGVLCCGSLIALLGLIAVFGGFTALNGQKFVLSIVASVLGSIGMIVAWGVIGFIIGFLAVLFLAIANDEFTT